MIRLPNFIIGGTSAGGTSFLSAAIVQHPEIYLPKDMRPEPHYFYKSWEYEKGLDYYHKRWFSEVKNEIAVGERSSSYLFGGEEVAKKMAAVIPDVKLIFTLRSPWERAWANYRYTALQGVESVGFEEAIFNEQQRIAEQKGIWAEIQPHNYTGPGYYGRKLLEFCEYFPKQQIMLICSEQMSAEPFSTLQDVYRFLGVDAEFKASLPAAFTSVNIKSVLKQKAIREQIEGDFDVVIENLRKGLEPTLGTKNNIPADLISELVCNLTKEKQIMTKKTRDYLRSLYEEELTILRKEFGFDTSRWTNGK